MRMPHRLRTHSPSPLQGHAPVRLVDVAFPLPIRREFTFGVPSGWSEDVHPGDRVVAPLAGRDATGVIVAATTGAAPEGLKHLRRPAVCGWRIPIDVLQLAHWVADYYLGSWGEALAVATGPFRGGSEQVFSLQRPDFAARSESSSRITSLEHTILGLLSSDHPLTLERLQRRTGKPRPALARILTHLCEKGFVAMSWRPRPVPIPRGARIFELSAGSESRIASEIREFFATARIPPEGISLGTLARNFPGGTSALRSIVESGFLRWDPLGRTEDSSDPGAPQPEPALDQLDPGQRGAVARLESLLSANKFATALLWGPTGSGKTAVYCAAIRKAWALGRRALFLVPEIGLATLMIRRLERSLGEPVGVWHSALTDVERHWMSRLIAQGQFRLVVGARSAVFAPISDLGLIVVDEEHAESYKQSEPSPRYQARDVAVVRARLDYAVCLLGSATPSSESFHNATNGKYHLLRLTQRVGARAMPVVRLVDLRQRHKPEEEFWITDELRSGVLNTLRAGRKAIVFLNRRGYATMVSCQSCGQAERCPDCGLTMTYHATDRTFRCHLCTRSIPAFDTCPSCGSADFLFRGVGTQKIEAALAELDPIVRIARLDADIASRRGAAQDVLSGFAANRFNLLVGTQMVTKGLDVADVGLVGVIWADQQMAFPDFRAEEKTFQLLTQVAGRAGRRGEKGEVLVQTFHPEHELIELAAGQNAELFFERELPRRQKLFYPPFSRLILLSFAAPTPSAARDAARDFTSLWIAIPESERRALGRLLGPAPAALPRRARQHVVHILIKTKSTQKAIRLVERFQDDRRSDMRKRKVILTVDVDPVDFM